MRVNMNTILEKVRTALRVSTTDFDDEITDIINACLLDLGIVGITNDDTTNALIIRAVITYSKLHFGDLKAVQGNYPNGDEIKFVFDEKSEAEADLVKIVGRLYGALGVIRPNAFTQVKKAA